MKEPNSKFLTYQNPEDNISIEVRLEDETVWLTIPQMAELFGVEKKRIIGTLKEGLNDDLDIVNLKPKDIRTFIDAGNNSEIECYNLEIIDYVGLYTNFIILPPFHTWAIRQIEEDARVK